MNNKEIDCSDCHECTCGKDKDSIEDLYQKLSDLADMVFDHEQQLREMQAVMQENIVIDVETWKQIISSRKSRQWMLPS